MKVTLNSLSKLAWLFRRRRHACSGGDPPSKSNCEIQSIPSKIKHAPTGSTSPKGTRNWTHQLQGGSADVLLGRPRVPPAVEEVAAHHPVSPPMPPRPRSNSRRSEARSTNKSPPAPRRNHARGSDPPAPPLLLIAPSSDPMPPSAPLPSPPLDRFNQTRSKPNRSGQPLAERTLQSPPTRARRRGRQLLHAETRRPRGGQRRRRLDSEAKRSEARRSRGKRKEEGGEKEGGCGCGGGGRQGGLCVGRTQAKHGRAWGKKKSNGRVRFIAWPYQFPGSPSVAHVSSSGGKIVGDTPVVILHGSLLLTLSQNNINSFEFLSIITIHLI